MTIDADVLATARYFGVDPALIQAVVQAEGNIVKAVQCSIPSVQTREEALRVLCRSAVHALSDYVKTQTLPDIFVAYWAKRWAPTGAANDPHHLNEFWQVNVVKLWLGAGGSFRSTAETTHG